MDATPDPNLVALLDWLKASGYAFVTPTPLTHGRVLKRDPRPARDARDALGWSRAFAPGTLDPELEALLDQAGLLETDGGLRRAAVRVSTVRGRLFLHSRYPTEQDASVFLGPDSYRFADFIARELRGDEDGMIVDVGGGGGVGAITAAGLAPRAHVLATDVNPTALRYARAAAAHAGVTVETRLCDGLDGVPDGLSIVLANPPYIAEGGQTYRDGGDLHGGRLSVDWARAALGKLRPGGRLLLYTGAAILDGGGNPVCEALGEAAAAAGAAMICREIDPDVFGEELETPAYAGVERIAVITCVMTAA